MSDPKARQILIDTYWTNTGWRDRPHISKEDLQWAMAAGVMFEPKMLFHNEMLEWNFRCYVAAAHPDVEGL